jgi:pimeloyl-ACP methyl ester carboxylesterase
MHRILSLLLLLFLVHPGPLLAATGMLNEYGGLIEPPIDWSGYPTPAKTGKVEDELMQPKTKNVIMKYQMYAPDKLPERRELGLILCFHGMNGNETHVVGWVHDTVKHVGLADDYVVIGLKSKGPGWADGDESDVLKTYDWLLSTYPIDKRRVFIVGHSNGSWWVTRFGAKHLDTIAGIVRYAGPGLDPVPLKEAPNVSEYYMVHGDQDDANSVDGSRTARLHLLQAHYHFVYRELSGKGHVNIVDNLDVRADMIHWIDSLRHKQLPLSAEEEKFLRQYSVGKKAADLFAKPEAWNEVLRIGGPQAGAVVAIAMRSDSATVREMAATACTRCLFAGEETIDGLVKLADDKSASVRTAALKALAVAADWRYEAAQLALGRIATRKRGPPDDRTLAASGLAMAAALPLLGNCHDDSVTFQALLALLDDEDASLRAIAFAPLKVAVKDGLGYDSTLGAADRKGPLAKWRDWFIEHAGSGDGKKGASAK